MINFKKAAESSDCLGMHNLATCYEIGFVEYHQQRGIKLKENKAGLEKNINRAAELYLESALQEYVPSMLSLALLLFRSAKQNRPLAFGGRSFLQGNSVNPIAGNVEDRAATLSFNEDVNDMYFECANWLRLAITLDEKLTEAFYLLGLIYEQGLSVDVNHELAFKHFNRAAQLGHVHALVKLGHLCFSGIKRTAFLADQQRQMTSNAGEVISLLANQEAHTGGPASGQAFSFVYLRPPDALEACKHYLTAIERGNDIEAYNSLGLLYEKGIGLDLDGTPDVKRKTAARLAVGTRVETSGDKLKDSSDSQGNLAQ